VEHSVFYDLVVAVPANQPDIVVVGGVATPTFGEATIRSTDAGVSFSGFGNDAQNPRNTSHVDVRAVVFHPRDPDIAWVGSDGGVVRNDGEFTSISSRCGSLFGNAAQCQTMLSRVPARLYFLNKGLQTMQFYNVSVDPQAPLRRMIGGLQDNGTIWMDGSTNDRCVEAAVPFGRRHLGVRLSSHTRRRRLRQRPEQPLFRELPERRSRVLGAHRRSHHGRARTREHHAEHGQAVS
jgi:hypothetical protein